MITKKEHPQEKTNLHPRNKHRERYNFQELIAVCPALATYVRPNAYQDDSIDFFNPVAVRTLNQALLQFFYKIDRWNIPPNYLCPPIPGRADYIHYMADVLSENNKGSIPTGNQIKCLDIGTGANCIYPILGHSEYGWSFVGSDIDKTAIQSARQIVEKNSILHGKIEIRLQPDSKNIFKGILNAEEFFDLSICNPPFHTSLEEARSGTYRKTMHLTQSKSKDPILNFGGQSNELWCEGGEVSFIEEMIRESKQYSTRCFWFSTLVSKQSHLSYLYNVLNDVNAIEIKTIPMGQGNKISRLVAWTFLNMKHREIWARIKISY